MSKSKKVVPAVSDDEDSEDIREDDDPSLKVQSVPAPRKSTRKVPASKTKPPSSKPSIAGNSRARKQASDAEEEQDMDDDESQAEKPSRPPSRTSRAESKKVKNKGKKKPPSDVDARVVKETLQDSEAPSESEEPIKKKETSTRSRSRSKSKPRASSKKPQSSKEDKPALLRAAERVRVSIIPEADNEEMAGDVEEPTPAAKPLSKQAMSKKEVAEPDVEEVPASKGRAKSKTKHAPESKSRASTSLSEKSADEQVRGRKRETPRKNDIREVRRGDADSVHERDYAADSNDHMDVDDDTQYETAYEERTPSPVPEVPTPVPVNMAATKQKSKPLSQTQAQLASQPRPPFPMSPSDFKAASPKDAKVVKSKKTLALKKAEMEMEADGEEADEPMQIVRPPTSSNAELRYRTPQRAHSPTDDDDDDHDKEYAQPLRDDDNDNDKENAAPLRRPSTPRRPNTEAAPVPLPTGVAEPAPATAFIPALASAPLAVAAQLSPAERAMTVEQWIRHEMERQAAQLRADGEKRIEAFQMRAEEVRRRIEAL